MLELQLFMFLTRMWALLDLFPSRCVNDLEFLVYSDKKLTIRMSANDIPFSIFPNCWISIDTADISVWKDARYFSLIPRTSQMVNSIFQFSKHILEFLPTLTIQFSFTPKTLKSSRRNCRHDISHLHIYPNHLQNNFLHRSGQTYDARDFLINYFSASWIKINWFPAISSIKQSKIIPFWPRENSSSNPRSTRSWSIFCFSLEIFEAPRIDYHSCWS